MQSRPTDSASNPAPNQTAAYTIASFHGHTPLTYLAASQSRLVGASEKDEVQDIVENVAGIVYDFLATSSGSDQIHGGHPLNHPFRAYRSEKTRRDTPYD